MHNKGIKAYFVSADAQEADPKVIRAYNKSMQKVLPQIIEKVRESEKLSASIPLSRSTEPRPKKKS